MKNRILLLVFAFLSLSVLNVNAQLGFKQGNKMSTTRSSSASTASLFANNGKLLPTNLSAGLSVNKIYRSAETARPFYIETTTSLKALAISSAAQRALAFLQDLSPVLGLTNPSTDFKVEKVQTDEYNQTHVRISQNHKGIPVVGSDAYVHFNDQKTVFHGTYDVLDQNLATIANVNKEEALQNVQNDLRTKTTVVDLNVGQKKLLDYTGPVANLVYYKYKMDRSYHLAYLVNIRPNFRDRWEYYVDATTGQVLFSINTTQHDGPKTASAKDLNGVTQSIKTYQIGSTYYMMDGAETMYNASQSKLPDTPVGAIWTIDGQNSKASAINVAHITSSDNLDWKALAVSAQYGAMATYNYYKNNYKRNGLDGEGSTIISIINVIDENGGGLENAFWNGKAMFFGNGGTYFKPLAGGLDVVAHELGHGVIEHTANLEYQDQSGALNESFADISGVMVDTDNWTLGEKITNKTTAFPNGILRDLSNPHNGGSEGESRWQPNNMSEFSTGTEDNGGVHTNSGIPNYAFYLFASASGMTRTKAGAIYYDVLSNYLTKYATFADLRVAVIAATTKKYGASSPELAAATAAFNQVGIADPGTSPNANSNLQPSTGGQSILLYDTDSNIFKSDETGNNILPVYKSPAYKASISDDSKVMVFVDADRKIRSIDLTTVAANNIPTATVIYNDTIFRSVAVSKDGTKIAAVRFVDDGSIYVAKLSDMAWTRYQLFNPTTAKGIVAAGVVRPDVLEWDYTGEKIVYDALNRIKNSDGTSIDYWDVGVISVWDNIQQKFNANANINKLFAGLPQYVSVGDPAFSKTSPNIIAFDYFYDDGNTQVYKVLGYNILTDSAAVLASPTTLGYPSFSKDDGKVIFTQSYDGNDANKDITNTVSLDASKFNPSGSPTQLLTKATSATYYTDQKRNLGNAPVANFQIMRKSIAGIYYQAFLDQSQNEPTSWLWSIDGPLFGSLYISGSEKDQNPVVSFIRDGTYNITLKVTNQYGTNSMTKAFIVGPNAVDQIPGAQDISIYPNPFTNQISLDASPAFSHDSFIKLFDLSGRLLKTVASADLQNVKIDASDLTTGVYILEIYNEQTLSKRKVIKQ